MARHGAERIVVIGQRLGRHAEVRIAALQEFLGAENLIARIECFDISHTMGEAPIASCVVYDKGATQNSSVGANAGREPATTTARCVSRSEALRQVADAEAAPRPDPIDGGSSQPNAARFRWRISGCTRSA